MEGINREQHKRKFFEFVEAVEERVGNVAEQKGSTYRGAQLVTRRLFESSGGSAAKVTDEDIVKAFDELDKAD